MSNSSQQFMGLLMQAGSQSAPSNLTPPVITGAAVQEGVTLTASPGTWQGVPNPSIKSMIWEGAPSPFTTYTPVAGGAGTGGGSSTYTPTAADVGNKLQVVVTASNGVAPDGVQTSAPVGPVLTAPPQPVPPPPVIT